MSAVAGLEVARIARDLADAVADEALGRVRRSLELERERIDSELAELRDEVVTLARRAPGEPGSLADEVARLNGRMASLTETVAALMLENTSHSRRVEP